MQLNQKEQRVLQEIQQGAFICFNPYMGRFNPHEYYSVDRIGKCTREVRKLLKLGLLDEKSDGYSRKNVFLTEEGKNFKIELDAPYDVWCVVDSFGIKVNKHLGYLKGNKLSLFRGEDYKETDSRKFFLDREKAFKYAIEQQNRKIKQAEGKVVWAKEELEKIETAKNDPTQDKAGYL